MYLAWSKTKKTEWRKKLKTKWRLEVPKHVRAKKHSYGVLYQCMPSSISRKCLLDGQTLAKTWCWRPRWPSEGQNVPLIMRKLRGYFPLFFRKTKNPLCSRGELVEKGWMALSQNTLKRIKRLLGFWKYLNYPKRRQRHVKVNFGDDGKRETSNRSRLQWTRC